jgi:outer membrane immunogenic protein
MTGTGNPNSFIVKNSKGRKMKKALFVILMIVGIMGLFAQGNLEKGKLQVNAGVGISAWGFPIYAGADYGVFDIPDGMGNITAGGELSYRSYGYLGYHHSIIGVVANGNYHFKDLIAKYATALPEKVDVYWGLNLGYLLWISPSGYGGTGSRLGFGTQLGGRYFLTDNIAAQLEFAGGTVFGTKLGITYKMK